jgi:hypothetical protein
MKSLGLSKVSDMMPIYIGSKNIFAKKEFIKLPSQRSYNSAQRFGIDKSQWPDNLGASSILSH